MKSRFVMASLAALIAYGCGAPGASPTASVPEPAALGGEGIVSTSASRNFRAHLSGREQVPNPVETRAQGQAIFRLSKDGSSLYYKVNVANIENVIGAHIHLAPAGQNGGVVLSALGNPIFIPDPGLTVNGTLVEGTATAADLMGPLAGQTLSALVSEMRSGNTYFNVHTVEFRPGEIRGQIR